MYFLSWRGTRKYKRFDKHRFLTGIGTVAESKGRGWTLAESKGRGRTFRVKRELTPLARHFVTELNKEAASLGSVFVLGSV